MHIEECKKQLSIVENAYEKYKNKCKQRQSLKPLKRINKKRGKRV